MMQFQTIEMSSIPVSPEIENTRRFYSETYAGQSGRGFYSPHDWARIAFVFGVLNRGGAVLDVGVGGGQFINALAASGHWASVTGIDVTQHSKFVRMTDAFDMHRMSVADMSFPDGSFDAVVCMEVLEHIDREAFLAGLGELRRVCRGQLLMSVPFEEAEPIPSYHKQRFTRADILRFWPEARVRLLRRPAGEWALMEEICRAGL